MKPLRTLVPLLLAGSLSVVPSAHAIYGPTAGGFGADIVSVDNASDEQGNAPTVDAAISADGRYVVFQTRATNFFEDDGGVVGPHGPEQDAEPAGTLREGGIFRYDRVTGAIQLVVDGTEVYTEGPEKGKLIFQGAQNPSVSADGRYVAFSTAQQLVPQDKNENVDVYVRDMSVPLTVDRRQSGAYTLVSAKSGGDEAATYAPREQPIKGAEPGSDVWPNTSISSDGRYVVFRTTESKSDLPDHAAVDTPPGQLFVRDLQTRTTVLLTRKATSATYPSGDPASSPEGPPTGPATGPATISADGSTVSWVSADAPEQTRFLRGENTSAAEPYYLWRRWQEAGAVTRRITGIADPDDPACDEAHEAVNPADKSASGPCYGPLNEPESGLASISLTAPALSSDGYTVAFLAGAALRPNITKSSGLDVFLTSMKPGVTRKAGTRELTLGVSSGNVGSTPSIESLAMSADGSTLAFTSLRTDFVLPEPKPVGAFRPYPTADDLYVIDLGQKTLERAVVSYESKDPNGSVQLSPTLTADGSTLAFVSYASNLIYGDGNEAPDAFTAILRPPAGTAPPSSEVNSSEAGFSLSSSNAPELGLHVKRARDGGLILLVETPGAGKLSAQARGRLVHAARATPMTHGKRGAGGRSANTLLARASAVAHSEGTTTLALRLAARYARYVQRHRRLTAAITVDFTPATAGERLTSEAKAAFLASAPLREARHASHRVRKG